MPAVPWRLRGLALLAVPALLLEEGTWAAHAAVFLVAAVYVAFWLAAPRGWSVAFAVLTIPAALAASLGMEQPSPATGLLWVFVAIAVCYAAPVRMSLAALIVVTLLAMTASLPLVSGGGPAGTRSLLLNELTHATLAVGLPVVTAGLAASPRDAC